MKLIGMMVVGPGEADRWLEDALKNRQQLVDDMVVVTNNAGPKEKALIKKYGFWQYEDNREWGLFQPKIKQDLLSRVVKLKPDYVLPSDADEIYDPFFRKRQVEALMKHGAPAYSFYIINLWNDENHWRRDLSFHNIRMFQYRPDLPMAFANKNVHCGLAPAIFYNHNTTVPFFLKHYGLMLPEDRKKKIERYEKYDPKNQHNALGIGNYYQRLGQDVNGLPFNTGEMHQRIKKDWQENFTIKQNSYATR